MYNSNRREILTWIQYMLIGLIAEASVIRWFKESSSSRQMIVWAAVAGGLGMIRIVIVAFSEWTRRDEWQSISRRNW